MPGHMLMANVEIITDGCRRRRWSAAEKLRIVEETLEDHASISVVARRNGVAPNLLYRWRRLMLEGGSVAVTEDDNVSFMARLAVVAHEHGLAIGQKNSAELVPRARELGTDFAVAEECNRYDECADYQAYYDNLVFVIEYRGQDFDQGCSEFPELSIVLRDLNLTTPSSSSYVFDGC